MVRPKQNYILYSIAFIVIYFAFFKPVHLKNSFTQKIDDVHCKNVWYFMADFSNMPVLNPEVIDFEILGESHGINGEWKYGVKYSEHFEHLPNFFENIATANYQVTEDTKLSTYKIVSQHKTCMIPKLDLFCLNTEAFDEFKANKNDEYSCIIEETIDYECPLALIPLCKAELLSQRTKVLNNLQEQVFEYF